MKPSMRTRPLVRVGIAALALTTVAACSSGTGGSGSDKGPSSEIGTQAADRLAALAAPHDDAPALDLDQIDTSGLAGKTVFYIPISLKAGHFPLVETNLQQALDTVGVKLHACDGQANPSGISSCLDQAVTTKAAAVITDYVPYELAATGISRVVDAGIPVYVAGATGPDGQKSTPKLAFDTPSTQGNVLMEGMVDATIADSDGKADLLLLQVIDSDTTRAAAEHALSYLQENCPDCKVTTKEVRLSQMKDVPSLVSSAVLSNPDIDYVLPQYDTYLAPAISGLQSATKANDVRLATTGATLAAIQQVKTNNQLFAVVGVNPPYLAWTIADAVLRLMAGQTPPASYPSEARAITKDNVNDLTLDAANEVSGAWFGDPAAFHDAFTKLWGAQ